MFWSSLDLMVVAIYAIALFAITQYVSREPKATLKSTEDYFLAGKSLPWWAIGAKYLPEAQKGLVFAAIVSSLASMVNSISTIFTMDVYKSMMKPNEKEEHYVKIGRIVAVVSMMIAVIAAPPFLGAFESAFQTVQEYTGFIAPGVVAVFLLGMFFKSVNSTSAFVALAVSVIVSLILKFTLPDFQFVNRIWAVFLLCMLSALVISKFSEKPRANQLLSTGRPKFCDTNKFQY